MEIWQAFVDESGDFDEPDNVVVAAVLCRGAGPSQVAMRAALEVALPDIPYPPHAAHLRVRSFLAAALLFEPPLERRAPAIVREVAGRIARSRDPEAMALRDEAARCRSEGHPAHYMDLSVLSRADAWIARTDFDASEALARVLEERQRALFDWVGAMGGSFSLAAAGQAGAASSARGAERYRAVLAAALERVEQLIGGRATVVVRPSRRHDSRAVVLDPLPGHPAPITVQIARMEGYGKQVHPAFVLADVAANRLRYVLRGSWRQARDRWGCALPLERAPRFTDTLLPAIGADDATRLAIRDAFRGRSKAALLAGLPRVGSRWEQDQAAAWIGAIP